MLYREIIAVCSQIHTKHINTLYGQNVELLNSKLGGNYSDHWALRCLGFIFVSVSIEDHLSLQIPGVYSRNAVSHQPRFPSRCTSYPVRLS